jgi:putative ABC transport system permease protein
MLDLTREFQHGWRRLRRTPVFTATALVVLGVGLGATTTMFSIVNAVLLRPLPFPNSERLVEATHTAAISGLQRLEQSDATFLLYQRHNTVFDDIGVSRAVDLSIAPADASAGDAERVAGAGVSASWLPTLRISPARGRAFTADDDRPGAPGVVVLSDGLWRRKFGADPAIVGRSVIINGSSRQVVGIMPPTFRYPSPSTQVWYPLQLDPAHTDAGSFNYDAVARLKPGATREAAVADLARAIPRLLDEYPSDIPRAMFEKAHLTPIVTSLHDAVVGDVSRLLWILLAAVGVLLTIACANVANLFLVRAEGRSRELAVRTALGAGGTAIVLHYLSEAILLALGGGAIGAALAAAGIRLLSVLPSGVSVPRLAEVSLDPIVGLFAVAITFASAAAVCAVPLLRTRRIAIAAVLKESGRATTTGAGRHRTRAMLVVAQIALALLLVASSGLLARSFSRLRDVNLGFDPANVTTARVALPEARYATAAPALNFYESLLNRTRALPGVRDAALSTWLPLTSDANNSAVTVEDYAAEPNAVPPVHAVNNVSSSWFATMRIPILSGRTLGTQDAAHPVREALVSRSFARRYWKSGSALGRRIHLGLDEPWFTVVGVVGDVHLTALDKPGEEAVYFPLVLPSGDSAVVHSRVALAVATNQAAPTLSTDIRRIVRDLDAGLPTYGQQSMDAIVGDASAKARFLVLMLGAASAIALVLGAVGIYGVMAYGVSLRQREIGVRMALGARPADVSRMISRQGLALASVGVVIGLAGAIASTRLLRGLLYDVSPTDPLTLGVTCAVLLATAFLSSWFPARRAANVDPASVLRSD